VAKTVSEGLIQTPQGGKGMGILFAALLGAIVWNLITWYYGLPSSSSHALFGGLIGATWVYAGSGAIHFSTVVGKVLVPLALSPIVAGLVALAGRNKVAEATPAAPEKAIRGIKDDIATVKGDHHG
jgi:PiT family inorganic phosphate transporter